MRNEVVLDLAEFSRVKSRTVQDGRTAVGNRSGRKNRTISGRRIQSNRLVTRSRTLRDNRTAARSRAVPDGGITAQSGSIQDDRRIPRGRTVTNDKTAQYSREVVSSGEYHRTRQRLWEQRRKKRVARQRMVMAALLLGVICVNFFFLFKFFFKEVSREDTISSVWNQQNMASDVKKVMEHPAWTENFLTVNEYSRPGTPLMEIKDIFVHYTANPNTDAVNNRSYFEQLKDTHERSASAHFIIGYKGDILQCIPLDEMAYAVKTRNEDSISIECCYQNEDGSFTQETYDSLVELLAWLVNEYDLTTDNILRHYDCGGKKCPLYYTEHEDAWELLKADVDKALMDL